MKLYSHKMCRRYGTKLCQAEKCPVTRRNYPPGIHGQKGRGRLTEYGLQLSEKQKAKVSYNVSESQFKLTFDRATKLDGDAGINLLKMLELRLDNVIYRLGIAKTRGQARQLVNHGHFLVNEKKVNIPSFMMKTGDVVSLHKSKGEKQYFKTAIKDSKAVNRPGWVHFDLDKYTGKVLHEPKKEDVEQHIDTQSIVEFYSRQ